MKLELIKVLLVVMVYQDVKLLKLVVVDIFLRDRLLVPELLIVLRSLEVDDLQWNVAKDLVVELTVSGCINPNELILGLSW